MTTSPASPSCLLGYQVTGADDPDATHPVGFTPVRCEQRQVSPIPLAVGAAGYLRPQLAVVLADDVTPEMTPGAVFLAIAGRCLVVTLVDTAGATTGVVIGERLLSPSASGPVALTGPAGTARCEPAQESEAVSQLQWLAASVELTTAGLSAGQLVLPVPRRAARPLPVAAGPWQVTGPDAAAVSLAFTAPAPHSGRCVPNDGHE